MKTPTFVFFTILAHDSPKYCLLTERTVFFVTLVSLLLSKLKLLLKWRKVQRDWNIRAHVHTEAHHCIGTNISLSSVRAFYRTNEAIFIGLIHNMPILYVSQWKYIYIYIWKVPFLLLSIINECISNRKNNNDDNYINNKISEILYDRRFVTLLNLPKNKLTGLSR